MTEAALINDWQTWEAWTEKPATGVAVVTESPYLAEKLTREGRSCVAPSRLLGADFKRDLAGEAVRLTRAIGASLDRDFGKSVGPVSIEQALKRNLFNFINSVLYRAAELDALMARYGEIRVPFLAHDPQNLVASALRKISFFQCNYFALLAQAAAGAEKVWQTVRLTELSDGIESISVRCNTRAVLVPAGERLGLLGLRLSGQTLQWGARIARRLSRLGRRAKTAYVHNETEFVRALYPALMAAGFAIRPFELGPKTDSSVALGTESEVSATILRALDGEFTALTGTARDAARSLMVARLSKYVAIHFLPLAADLRQRVASWLKSGAGSNAIVLSNGIFDSRDVALGQLLDRAGVPFVAVEHGAATLTELDVAMEGYLTDKSNCTGFIAHYPDQEGVFRRLTGDAATPIFAYGVRRRSMSAQCATAARLIGRRYLRVSRSKTLALYAPTRFKDDLLLLSHETSDADYWDFQKRLITEVFGAVKATEVFVKLHQKGWLPGQKSVYDLRRHPLEITDLPPNVRWGAVPQLNYIRWAADIILVDRATSTVQWALCADRPLIYLDAPFNPLTSEAREAFQEALFYVDCRTPDWSGRVRDWLEIPLEALERKWQDKAAARKRVLESSVLGPEAEGRDLARWLSELQTIRRFAPGTMMREKTV